MILTVTANPAIDKAYFVKEFVLGNAYRPQKMSVTAGGKGLNVSRVASLLGEKVCATGFLGGSEGEFIRSQLKNWDIQDGFIAISEQTRTCINIVNSDGISGEILEKGPTILESEKKAFFDNFISLLDSADIVCVSGSLPNGLDENFYIEIIELCKKKNKPIIVDTSGKTLSAVIKNTPFMVKPNSQELRQIFDDEHKNIDDLKASLNFLKSSGVSVPFITLGKNGSVALIDDEYCHFSVPEVEVKSSVGSGDSTVAGIAVGLSKKLPLLDAIKLGMATGLSNTQFSETGMISVDGVKKYYEQIKVITF